MSDEISKVDDPCRRAIATVCEGFTLPDAARKILETAMWAPRTEAATAPEGCSEDDSDAALRYIHDWCPDSVRDYVATLARQLAEANERAVFQQAITKELLPYQERAVKAEIQLAKATRVLRWAVNNVLTDSQLDVTPPQCGESLRYFGRNK